MAVYSFYFKRIPARQSKEMGQEKGERSLSLFIGFSFVRLGANKER